MSRYERYGTRDLTYSAWHRKLDDDLSYIDLDAIEYDNDSKQPLALFELARDVGQLNKPTTVMVNLARRAIMPAYCVLYMPSDDGDGIKRFRMKRVHPRPTGWEIRTPEEYTDFLRRLRSQK